MVRLKGRCLSSNITPVKNFNSNMVRLKEENFVYNVDNETNFNSNMVRLKAGMTWRYIDNLVISIPIWFD